MCIFKMEIVEKEKNKSTKNVMSMVVPKLTEMKKKLNIIINILLKKSIYHHLS